MVAIRLMGWFSRKELADMAGYDNLESYTQRMIRISKKMGL
jgi:hypothetical protein